MLDVLDSDTAATQPAVKDDGFMEQVYGQICSEGQDGFGEDELGTFAAETVGLPTAGSGGAGQVKTILRDISRGDERATLARLQLWWHDTALSTPGASGSMSPSDDFRRGLRLLGLFNAAREAVLCRLPGFSAGAAGEQIGAAEDDEDFELRQLFQRCDTSRSKHLQMSDIARVALDLGLLLSYEQLRALLRELDMSHSNRVGFVEFKSWWDADAERSWFASSALRRRLRLCGMLMNTRRTVLDVYQLAMDISDDEGLAELVDDALDQIVQRGTRKQVVDLLHDGKDPDEVDRGLQGKSLGLIPPQHPIRQACHALTSTRERGDLGWWFELIMTVLIMLNLAGLALVGGQGHRDNEDLVQLVNTMNLVVGIVFTAEVVMGVMALGFVQGDYSYLRSDGANVFDFIIIVAMWLLLLVEHVPVNVSFALIAVRAFHVLKFFPGMKEIIGSIVHGSQALWLVLELMILCFVIFAILGRELFAGSMSVSCNAANNHSLEHVCPLTFECVDCYEIEPGTGLRPRPQHQNAFGFDNFFVAMVSVFSATALDEWPTIAQPIRQGDSELRALAWPFFMCIVLILNLVGVNLFLASVTFSYTAVRREKHAHTAMHNAHQMLVDTLLAENLKPQSAASAAAASFEVDEGGRAEEAQPWTHRLMEAKAFDMAVTVTVVVNIICLAVVHQGMDSQLADALDFLDYAFTAIYVFEASVKIHAMGFKAYWQVKMNRLDLIIVMSALVGYLISIFNVNLNSMRILRVMRIARAARALRVGKFIFKFERTKRMLSMAFGHIDAAVNLLALMCYGLVVFGVVAMHLFGDCTADMRLSRSGFDDFWLASMTNFQILSGDDWAWSMYEYMECLEEPELVVVYFVLVHLATAFIMVNLFVAIFLENFFLSDEDKRQKQIDQYVKKTVDKEEAVGLGDVRAIGMLVDAMYAGSALLKRAAFGFGSNASDVSEQPAAAVPPEIEIANGSAPSGTFETDGADKAARESRDHYMCGTRDSGFRKALRHLVEPKEGTNWYHRFIELAIVLSGAAMAVEGPTGTGTLGCLFGLEDMNGDGLVDPWLTTVLIVADYVFYFVFLSECIFNIVAFGLYSNDHAYLRTHRAHWFDFAVVLINSLDMLLRLTYPDSDTEWMKVIRLMRILRLLRLLEDVEEMALMAQAIEHSMFAVSGLIGLLLGSIAMFGIVGISLFMGLFWHCSPTAVDAVSFHGNATVLAMNKTQCETEGLVWQNLYFSFDSLPQALRTLFVCMTRQGWMEIFWGAVDTTEHELAPALEDNYISATVFFVLFVLINAFLLEQLFVGILVDVFSQSSGHALLTTNQKNWQYVNMCIDRVATASRTLPTGPNAERCQEILHDAKITVLGHRFPVFKGFLNAVIIANVSALVMNSAIFPINDNVAFDHFNNFCLGVYTIEVLIKAVAFGFAEYAREETVDLVVVAIMWPVAIHAFLQHEFPDDWAHKPHLDWIQGLQIVRVFRTFDLINSSNRLRKLVHTIRLSWPHVKNLAMLMFLTFFVFAVCAMKLLGSIPLDTPGLQIIGEWNNFSTFRMAMMLLFQVTTGQPLPALILDCRLHSGNPASVVPFFSTFYIVTNFVFLNLFIALLLENFEYNWSADFVVTEEDVRNFKGKWHIATDAKDEAQPLELCHVREFVEGLAKDWPYGDRLGPCAFEILVKADKFWFNRLLLELDLTLDDVIYDQKRADDLAAETAPLTEPLKKNERHNIHFHELLLALARMRFGPRCLEFDREVEAEHKMQIKHEEDARRMITIFVNAWRMARDPPPHIVTDADRKRWKAAVGVARLWILKAAIKTIRISNQRTWQHRQIDDVIGDALHKRREEAEEARKKRSLSPHGLSSLRKFLSHDSQASHDSEQSNGNGHLRKSVAFADVPEEAAVPDPAPKTDTAATRSRTKGAILGGLRSGALEGAVAKMERDTAAEEAAQDT